MFYRSNRFRRYVIEEKHRPLERILTRPFFKEEIPEITTLWRRELDLNLQDPSFNWLSTSQEALELSGREQ
jgi:hypothetical protein